MNFNLWKTDFLVSTNQGYEYDTVITTEKPSVETLNALINSENYKGHIDEVYASLVCIGVGAYGELLWGEVDA